MGTVLKASTVEEGLDIQATTKMKRAEIMLKEEIIWEVLLKMVCWQGDLSAFGSPTASLDVCGWSLVGMARCEFDGFSIVIRFDRRSLPLLVSFLFGRTGSIALLHIVSD